MDARSELDQIRQRHDEDHEHPAGEVCDNRAMVAALTAALDLADECEEVASLAVFNEEWRDAHAMFATTLRAAITEHLTRKGKPHLAIAKLTSWRETATAIAAGLGTQPVEWLDEDDAVRDDGDLVEGFVDGFLAAHEAATPRSGSTSAPTQIEKGDRA